MPKNATASNCRLRDKLKRPPRRSIFLSGNDIIRIVFPSRLHRRYTICAYGVFATIADPATSKGVSLPAFL
jgi:hypothetical protein